MQIAAIEIDAIQVCDFIFAPWARLQVAGDVGHGVVVEIEARHGKVLSLIHI